MTDFIQANTAGRLHDATEPSISPLNRGFLYGDAIYEVWRTYHSVVFAFDEHWARLGRSARALHMSVELKPEVLIAEIKRTAQAFRERTAYSGELYVRLQLTRGAGPIGLDVALADRPLWVLFVQRLKTFTLQPGRRGLRLSIARELRRNPPNSLNPAWKTGNYLNNLLCLREARTRGADEVVILNHAGAMSEAAVCNLFLVRSGEVLTPKLEEGILEGITRQLVLRDICRHAGVPVRETTLLPGDLASCEECFLTSTTRDIAPVEAIDDYNFAVGPDTVTARLKQAFETYAAEYAARHPQWRV